MDRQSQLKNNLRILIEEIEKERLKYSSHQIINLIAVSKYVSMDDIKALYCAGHRAFGENKIQSLKEKSSTLENLPLQWHMIGSIQKNKINQLISIKPYIQRRFCPCPEISAFQRQMPPWKIQSADL